MRAAVRVLELRIVRNCAKVRLGLQTKRVSVVFEGKCVVAGFDNIT